MILTKQLGICELRAVRNYIEASTGIILPDTNYSLLENFLKERLELFNIGIDQYLEKTKNDKDEHIFFIDTITINETYFFREEKHFDILLSHVFPEMKERSGYPVKIWSLACSTGEEAISLFLAAEKFFGSKELFFIFASDVSRNVLKFFEAGLYKKNSFRDDGRKYHGLVEKISEKEEKFLRINRDVLDKINKRAVNLSNLKNEKIEEKFDLIFLRNVLIYFENNRFPFIINDIVELLKDDGFLFLSSSEVPFVSNPLLELREVRGSYFFRKKNSMRGEVFKIITAPLIDEIKNHEGRAEIKKSSAKIPDPNLILDYACQKLNNKLFSLPGNNEYELALILIEIIYFLNNNEFLRAGNLLEQFREAAGENEVFCYISGYMSMMKNNDNEAIAMFDRSLVENPSFWPARFYRARLYLENNNKTACRDFEKCLIHIEQYINRGSHCYQILLDGFNGKYFFSMCEKWIHKIKGEGHTDGAG